MKVTSHATLIRRRRRQAVASSVLGFLILGAGLVASLQGPRFILFAYGTLIVGSLFSWVGLWLSDTWLRTPRPDTSLDEALQSAGAGYALYHWVLPAEHVLLTPWGLVVIAVLNHDGPVEIQGSRWRERRSLAQRLLGFGRRPLRNPKRWLEIDARQLAEAIRQRSPDLGEVPISLLAVFSRPRIELTVSEPDLPVVRAEDLRAWLRSERREALKPAVRRRLEVVLDDLARERLEARPTTR